MKKLQGEDHLADLIWEKKLI